MLTAVNLPDRPPLATHSQAIDVTDVRRMLFHLGSGRQFMAAGTGTLPSPPPAATLLIVKALADPALLVEIEAIAVG